MTEIKIYYTQRFEVYISNIENPDGLFYVYDNDTGKRVSKGYKYSRYAYNLQNELEANRTN